MTLGLLLELIFIICLCILLLIGKQYTKLLALGLAELLRLYCD